MTDWNNSIKEKIRERDTTLTRSRGGRHGKRDLVVTTNSVSSHYHVLSCIAIIKRKRGTQMENDQRPLYLD